MAKKGRPKNSSPVRNKQVMMRITDLEYGVLLNISSKTGRSKSNILRAALSEYVLNHQFK